MLSIFKPLCLALLLLPCVAASNPSSFSLQDSAAEAPDAPGMTGWTVDERLALGLHQLTQGHLTQGLSTLQDLKDAQPSDAAKQRIQRASDRAQQLIKSRVKLIQYALVNKKKLRWPMEDKIVMLKPKSWKDGVLTVGKSSKHTLTELRSQDMSMAFLAANFQKKSERYGAEWLESYCRCLAGEPNWSKALPKKFTARAAFESDMQETAQWIAAGPTVQALIDGMACTENNPADFGALAKQLNSVPFLAHRKAILRSKAEQIYTAQLQTQGLAASLHAEVQELGEGRVRLTYTFSNASVVEDFEEDDSWWKKERESYDAQPESSKAPWVDKGSLMLQGKHSLAHRLQFEGDMALEMVVRQAFNRSKPNVGTLIAAINASPPFHFARSSFGTLIAIEGSTSQPAIQELGKSQKRYSLGDGLRTKLWSKDKKAFLEFHGNDVSEVAFTPNKPGTALIWVHSIDAMGIEQLIIEGRPTDASVLALGERWLKTRMQSLDE